MARIQLSPPWCIYVDELTQMFKYDEQVHVVFDEEHYTVKLYVDDTEKAEALSLILPSEKIFGKISLIINVVYPNGVKTTPFADNYSIYSAAFKGNKAVNFIKKIEGIIMNGATYVVFRNEVVQYFNDDIGDIYGQCSTLFQEIAKNIFCAHDGVYFCTDIGPNNVTEYSWP